MSICMRCGGDCTCHRHGRADEELFYVCCEGLKYPPDHKGHCMERIRKVLDKVQQPKSDGCGDGWVEYVEVGLLVAGPYDEFAPKFFKLKDHFGAVSMKLDAEEKGFGDVTILPVFIKKSE